MSTFLLLSVRIERTSSDVPRNVLLWGWNLKGAIDGVLSRAAVVPGGRRRAGRRVA